jgi:hypothetical protein
VKSSKKALRKGCNMPRQSDQKALVAIDIYPTQVITEIACFSVQQESPFIKVTEKVSSDTEPRHS